MFFLKFTKKENLRVLKLTNSEGHFKIEPLYPGWGVTIGNTLRRVLLSSLEGYAISSVKIEGVDHEFATIKGVKEDMTEIILNLKKIRFKNKIEDEHPGEKFNIIINNEKEEITAGDLGEYIHLFEIINPDLIILNKNKLKFISLNITIVIKKGIGYVPSISEEKHINPNGTVTISMDSIFTPIEKVKYTIENCSVSKNSTYERLFLEIKTDGTINPKDALIKASNLVIRHFKLLKKISLNYNKKYKKYKKKKQTNENYLKLRNLFNSSLERKNLSVRTLNCLKKAKILTWGDLIKSNPTKYLGKKYNSILGLIKKVDLRLVNKKVLENLVVSGAFDNFKIQRSQYFYEENGSNMIEKILKFGVKYK
ncbi:MAG: DNA-directed RNA polymerase subunit alpha, partial [Candidatus Karelsulcia muelleri]